MTHWRPKFLLGICFAALTSPVFLIDFFSASGMLVGNEYYERLFLALVFNMVISFCVPFALMLMPKTPRVVCYFLFALICTTFSALSLFHMLTYGQLIASPSVTALLDSNITEAREYLTFQSTYAKVFFTLVTFIFLSLLAIFTWKLLSKVSILHNSKAISFLALAILLALGGIGKNKLTFAFDNPIAFTYTVGSEVLSKRAEFDALKSMKAKYSDAKMLFPKNHSLHIVIIGESATRSHMSLYGYQRETNPLMKKINHLNRFQGVDVCSTEPLTQLSLSDIMLGGEKLTFEHGLTNPNLISKLKDAGYKTYWISNQPGGAGYFSASSAWFVFADHSDFVNKRDFRMGYDFDEQLIPAIEKTLASSEPNKVIFIHLMGSHPDYKQRYPKNFEYWKSNAEVPNTVKRKNDPLFREDIYNAYDNSILYSDFIISKVLEMAISKNAASITYFSDHGQNLGENSDFIGHSLYNGPRQGFDVPLIFWLNEDKVNQLNLDLANFRNNLNKPYSLEKIQFTLLDLFGVSQRPTNQSLFSNNFTSSKRHCDTLTD
jgi:heptose-I-phosphate ethanolaminephosphotransferase